ncbi:unnamed protein product [Caenorhabditis brenneri]
MNGTIPKKYRETRLNELNIPVENIRQKFTDEQGPSTFKKGLIGFYDNDSYLIYNTSLMTDEEIPTLDYQLFLMDKSDVEHFEDPSGGNKNINVLKNLETFMSLKPDKKIYLRKFKLIDQGFEFDCAFKDEVLTILPMVFQQQGGSFPTEGINALRSEWTEKIENARSTYYVVHLSAGLPQYFDIDKSLITLVNDLFFTKSCHDFFDNGGDTKILLQNQDGKDMQLPSHAAFYHFTTLICDTNWSNYKKYEVLRTKREDVLQELELYCSLGTDFMIDNNPTPLLYTRLILADYYDYHIPLLHYNDFIPISDYLKMCKEYGLPNYREHVKRSDGRIEVYLVRAFLVVGWIELVFDNDRELDGIRDLLLDGLSFLIPKNKLEDFQYFLNSVVFPVGLYSKGMCFKPRFANKEENKRIAKLAAANEKRKQKLQEKKNGKKKKPEGAAPEKTELQVVVQNEREKANQEFHQLVEQLGIVYFKNEHLDRARNSDDVGTVEEAPSENQARSSKKKNNKKKRKRQAASEKVAEDAVENAQPAEELAPAVEPVADPVPQPAMPVAVEPEVVEPEAAEPVAAEPANPPPAPRDPKQESSSCSKCLRTSKKCQEAIKAANIAQSKADSFESKAKRTEEVEKKMREMEEEMRQMKIQLTAHIKHSEENERLRQKISKREKIEEDLRREKKELIHKNENLEMEIRNMDENSKQMEDKITRGKLECDDRIALIESATLEIVNALTAKTYVQEEEITYLKDSMNQKQTELFKAMEINGKYHMENSLLKSKVNRLENDITKLREHASQALEPVVMDRRKLLELRKLKDDFGRNTIMEEAQEKVDKINTLPDTTENLAGVLEAAENELTRLETSIYNYQDFLDLNVRIYQKSHDISKILELPEYPKISDGFSDLYARLFPVRPPDTGIPDTDCPICYETRQPEEQILGCNGCPYVFHLSCLRKWFEDKKGCTKCPQCQKTLRDPDQYPMLQKLHQKMKESIPKKHDETVLSELKIPVENIKQTFPAQQRPSTFNNGFVGFYDNDSYLTFNTSFIKNEMNTTNTIQLFLMDKSDVEFFEDPNGGNKNINVLKNLETFMFFKPNKKIYLRLFKLIDQGFEFECVFKQEVLTILPLVFKQQGGPIQTEEINALRSEWTETRENASSTIELLHLALELCRRFDINQSLITLVNDLQFTANHHSSLEDGGRTKVVFQNQFGKCMQHPSHAAISYFQSLVCVTHWHDFRDLVNNSDMIFEQMREYQRIGKDFMIEYTPSSLTHETDELSELDYRLSDLCYDDPMSISIYLKMCKSYGIPNYKEHIKSSNGKMDVYLARAFMVVGWIQMTFQDSRELDETRDLLLDGLSSQIPKDKLDEFQYFLKNVVFPVGLYSRNEYFAPRFANPNKEEDERIAKLAAANEKRKQKLQEKKNGKKMKPERAVPEKTEPQVVSHNEEERASQEFHQLAEQLGLVYDVKSLQYVKKEDLNNAQNSNDVGTVESAPSEILVKSSKKKNNKKKKKRQTASEEVGEEVAENAQPAEELEPDVEPIAEPVPQPAMPEAAEPVAAELANPPPAPRDPKQESSSCSKCLRTSKKCQEAIKAANVAQSKADSFESKAKRTEEVEKKMREMEEEMRQMKLQLATHSKHSEENERLRQKMSKREKIEEELRREKKEVILKTENLEMEIRNLNDKSKQMVEKIDQGKRECDDRIALIESATLEVVNALTAKANIQEEEITNLKNSMSQKQKELFQAIEINGKYHMENSLLKSKVNRLENDITRLREQASQALEPVVMDRRKLLELRKLKDDFGRNTIMEEAKEKVNKIKNLPDTTENLAEALEGAENELIRLETLIYNYQDFLDLNVRIYQKSHDISKILDLPEYPKISDGFSDLYSRLFPVRAPETGIPDTDCPICYDTRLPGQQTLECDNDRCPYIFHLSCLRKWFEDKKGCTKCPQCQKTLRDPDQQFQRLQIQPLLGYKKFTDEQGPSTFKKGLIGFYDNDSYLIYNTSLMTDEEIPTLNYQLFLMDKSDVEYFEDPSGGNKNINVLKNLETFMSLKPDKKIYLRKFKLIDQGFEFDCAFKDEVLTILPMVFQQQGGSIPTEGINALRSEWTELIENARSTYYVVHLSAGLPQYFDIDKSLITLVNDLFFTKSCHDFFDNGGDTKILLQNQDGKDMQLPSHAAFYHFTTLICDTNWSNYKKYEVLRTKREDVLQELELYCSLGTDFMIDNNPTPLLYTRLILADYYDYHIPLLHYNDVIPISDYLKMCKEYGLPNYREHVKRSDGRIEVYLVRAFLVVGWIELVFDNERELDGIRDLLIDGVSFLIPKNKLEDFQYFLNSVVFPVGLYSKGMCFKPRFANKEENKRIAKLAAANEKRNQKLQEKKNAKKKKPVQAVPEKTEPQVVTQTEREKANQEFHQLVEQLGIVYFKNEHLDKAQNSHDVETVEEAPSENQKKSSKKKNNKKKKKRQAPSEEVGEDAIEGTVEDGMAAEDLEPNVEPVADPGPQLAMPEIVEPVAVEPDAAEPANPSPAPRDPKQESSSCSKCLRTSKKCQEAIKAANLAQSKADSFESKAKRTEEVEKKMREMEEEMMQMKIQLATHSKHSEENERLRQKISKREKIEEELRKEKKELILKNENLEMEIRNLNEKSKQMEEKIDQRKRECDDRIALIESATLEVVNALTSKTYAQDEEITNLKDSMSQKQTELFKAMEINGKYHMENSLLKSKMNRLENEITRLREHASQALEPVVMDRRKLLELRKLKDDFGRKTIMEEAKEKVDKIKTLPDTTEDLAEALEAAENELIRLETSIYNYQDFLDLNVRIYQKSHDISKILNLSEYPKISDGFSDLYARLFPVRPPDTGIPDTDCPICYETRQPEEQILECNGCPYIFHLSCLRKWFEDKKGCTKCPQCQKTLRDPDQYPVLG